MERYKRLVQFFSNPEKTLKDLYPFQIYSNSENSLDFTDRERNHSLHNEDRSGSEYSVSRASSHSHYSRTFVLDDPPSRLELKRRPRKGPVQNAAQAQGRAESPSFNMKNLKAAEPERSPPSYIVAEAIHTSTPTHRSANNASNNSQKGSPERARKRRRSPDTYSGSTTSQTRDISTAGRRKPNFSKFASETPTVNLGSELPGTQRASARSPKSSTQSPNQSSANRPPSHGTSKTHSHSTISSANSRGNGQSTNQSARSCGKSPHETSRSPPKTRNEARCQRDTSPSKRAASVKPVTVKNRQELHFKEICEVPQIRSTPATSVHRSTHTSQTRNRSPTKSKIHTLSSQDATHKSTKTTKHQAEEVALLFDNIGEGSFKAQQNNKSRKLKKEGVNHDSTQGDNATSLSSKSDKQESNQRKNVTTCENTNQKNDLTSIRVLTPPSNSSPESKSFTVPNAIFSPLKGSFFNPCLTSEGQLTYPSLSNKDVACVLEHSGDAQKRSVKATSSWKSTGSESTEGESLLDLDKFKQAIMSFEIPSEYLEQAEETETSENVFNILETISESPLEECITVRTHEQSEAVAMTNEKTRDNKIKENTSERTINGSEDLSEFQCTYVYERDSQEDQFQLQWIKLENTADEGTETQIHLPTDRNCSGDSKDAEIVHVSSMKTQTNRNVQTHCDAENSQQPASITLPTKSPQSHDNSVVDIIVLRKENLTEEQVAAIERYKSGMKKRRHRNPLSSTNSNKTSQRMGDPIVIPISDSHSNPKSTTGFAVLADWPEVPLSVDVDVKSWLCKSDTEETDSVIYVNQSLSKRSQNTSLWASQTILDNISDYDLHENEEKCHGENSSQNQKILQSLSERAYEWSVPVRTAQCTQSYENRVNEVATQWPKVSRQSTVRGEDKGCVLKEFFKVERPKTAPNTGQKLTITSEKQSRSHNYRSKSSNNSHTTRSKTQSPNKTSEELEDIISQLKDYEKLIRENTESLQRSKSPNPHHSKTRSKEFREARNTSKRSPSRNTSCSTDDDNIKVLFSYTSKQKEDVSPTDSAPNEQLIERNNVSRKRKPREEDSKSSDRLSHQSASSCTSERTSGSMRLRRVRPKSASSSYARKDDESFGASDTSKETDTVFKKRNRRRGRSCFQVSPKSEEYVSRSTQIDKENFPRISESLTSDQPKSLSPDITKPSTKERTTQCAPRDQKLKHSGKISVWSHESTTSSDKNEPGRTEKSRTEKSGSHLQSYLETISKFREKCGKKDLIIGVLIEQLTSLPLNDNTRRCIAEKVSARLEEECHSHRDYTATDILQILQMRSSTVDDSDEKHTSTRENKYSEEKTERKGSPVCACPKDFKIAGSVGCDCLLLTWKSSPQIEEIAGYMVEVDGELRQRVRSATRTSALLIDLDLKKRMHLALRTELRAGGEPTCHPPLQLEYAPYVEAEQHWSIGNAQR